MGCEDDRRMEQPLDKHWQTLMLAELNLWVLLQKFWVIKDNKNACKLGYYKNCICVINWYD
jgi:hypothetical protein